MKDQNDFSKGEIVRVRNVYVGRVDGLGEYLGKSWDHRGKHLVKIEGMAVPVDYSNIYKV